MAVYFGNDYLHHHVPPPPRPPLPPCPPVRVEILCFRVVVVLVALIADGRVSTVYSKSFLRFVKVWTLAMDTRRSELLLLMLDSNLRTLVSGLGLK